MWNQLTEFVQDQLKNNALFQGGLLLMAGGAALALVRAWPGRIWGFIQRQSMVSIDIPDRDQAFQWINGWLAKHNYSKNRARSLTVKSERNEREHGRPTIIFSPAPGTHYLWYKRRLMILSRNRQDQAQGDSGPTDAGSLGKDPFREFFTIRIVGRCRDVALSLIQEAYEVCHPNNINKVTVHRTDGYGNWRIAACVPHRPLDSVIFSSGVSDYIASDIQTFLDTEAWYVDRSIPYQRGYLFYGPPGNGKTSAITALASHFNFDIALLNLKTSRMDDNDLAESIANVPARTVLVLEDIDCVAKGRKIEDEKISFSGLLNALDGLSASHGQIVFMTTNFRDKLDSALIRPGRCDVQIKFSNATPYQKLHLFERFFPDSNLAANFSTRAPDVISMASLQGHFMEYRNDPQAAVDQANTIERCS